MQRPIERLAFFYALFFTQDDMLEKLKWEDLNNQKCAENRQN